MSLSLRPTLVVLGLVCCAPVNAQSVLKLKHSASVPVAVQEPSDLVLIPGSVPPRFLVVSDNGYVAEILVDGTLVRRSEELAFDLEGALLHNGELMVVDERTRRVLWLDTATFQVNKRLSFPYGGGRNKGYEAMVWNPVKQRFLLITERDPVLIVELDTAFRVVNEVDFDRTVRDISSATWHDGHPWLLSDMDMQVMKCDPLTYKVLERYAVPIINPEGFAFDGNGNLYVLSDDRQRLYTFPFPPQRAD